MVRICSRRSLRGLHSTHSLCSLASVVAVSLTAVLLEGCGASKSPKTCGAPPSPAPGASPRPRPGPPNLLSWEESHGKAKKLLASMDMCEKLWLMQGIGWSGHSVPDQGFYVGTTPGNPRLGIPSLNMNDAAGGFRTVYTELVGTVTCWPSLLAMAATWSAEAVEGFGVALGEEFVGKGANGILGPSINVHRVARGGRNFEYLSGEDPYLGSVLAEAYVRGVQSQGVMAIMKHFILNNQETNRNTMSANADEKTKWELYYKPFLAAVRAGASGVMCSYNKEDGIWSCQNEHELGNLKNKMGFQGFVQSDWWATHGTDVSHGLDQEMPGAPTGTYFSTENLLKVEPSAINASAQRILAAMYHMDLFNSTRCTPPNCEELILANVTSEAHKSLAREAATESIVLLKNNGVLPLTHPHLTVAVVGSASTAKPYNPAEPDGVWNTGDYYSGGGSGHVTAGFVVTPLDAIRAKAAEVGIKVISSTTNSTDDAKKVAQTADVTIVVAATTSGEGADRDDLSLDNDADVLIAAVSSVAKKTVVICQIPGAVLMPWREKVDGIAAMFLGGEETGPAWAAVLFGDKAPAGRLPIMIPQTVNDTISPGEDLMVDYSEGMKTSYRNKDFKAAYPFGHGLTYTTFMYGPPTYNHCHMGLQVGRCVTLSITNTGTVAGKAVAQLYLEFPPEAGHPAPLLKGFQKTDLISPGDKTDVRFLLGDDELSWYDASADTWVQAARVTAHIGESSTDIRQKIALDWVPAHAEHQAFLF